MIIERVVDQFCLNDPLVFDVEIRSSQTRETAVDTPRIYRILRFPSNSFLLSIIPQRAALPMFIPPRAFVSILFFAAFHRANDKKKKRKKQGECKLGLNESIKEWCARQEATRLLLPLLTKWSNESSGKVIWTLSGFNWTRNDFRTSLFSPRRENAITTSRLSNVLL